MGIAGPVVGGGSGDAVAGQPFGEGVQATAGRVLVEDVATADHTGRCRVLHWSQVDQQISIGPPHVEQFMGLIGKRLAAWQHDDSG